MHTNPDLNCGHPFAAALLPSRAERPCGAHPFVLVLLARAVHEGPDRHAGGCGVQPAWSRGERHPHPCRTAQNVHGFPVRRASCMCTCRVQQARQPCSAMSQSAPAPAPAARAPPIPPSPPAGALHPADQRHAVASRLLCWGAWPGFPRQAGEPTRHLQRAGGPPGPSFPGSAHAAQQGGARRTCGAGGGLAPLRQAPAATDAGQDCSARQLFISGPEDDRMQALPFVSSAPKPPSRSLSLDAALLLCRCGWAWCRQDRAATPSTAATRTETMRSTGGGTGGGATGS